MTIITTATENAITVITKKSQKYREKITKTAQLRIPTNER